MTERPATIVDFSCRPSASMRSRLGRRKASQPYRVDVEVLRGFRTPAVGQQMAAGSKPNLEPSFDDPCWGLYLYRSVFDDAAAMSRTHHDLPEDSPRAHVRFWEARAHRGPDCPPTARTRPWPRAPEARRHT